MELVSAKKICRAFSSASIAPIKRAPRKTFGEPVSAWRSLNTSHNSTAAASKRKAKLGKARRFVWFCRSHKIRTTKTESRNCRASVSDAAAFHRNVLQFRCHSSFVLRHFRLSHKRNSKDFDQLNWPRPISLHDEILQNENPSWTHNRVWTQRDSIGADDDKRRRCNVSVSDLLKVVR